MTWPTSRRGSSRTTIAGEYEGYLEHAETIEPTVGTDAVRAAFFLGHVEHIGLKPNGEMIDPAPPTPSSSSHRSGSRSPRPYARSVRSASSPALRRPTS